MTGKNEKERDCGKVEEKKMDYDVPRKNLLVAPRIGGDLRGYRSMQAEKFSSRERPKENQSIKSTKGLR